mmetsp:Transcript_7213/g.13112  ORF Transcript_7213/g.13112 Transcript_7213/m.13112 type:complete len:500 (-) Transcript_7213:1182-2681(-)
MTVLNCKTVKEKVKQCSSSATPCSHPHTIPPLLLLRRLLPRRHQPLFALPAITLPVGHSLPLRRLLHRHPLPPVLVAIHHGATGDSQLLLSHAARGRPRGRVHQPAVERVVQLALPPKVPQRVPQTPPHQVRLKGLDAQLLHHRGAQAQRHLPHHRDHPGGPRVHQLPVGHKVLGQREDGHGRELGPQPPHRAQRRVRRGVGHHDGLAVARLHLGRLQQLRLAPVPVLHRVPPLAPALHLHGVQVIGQHPRVQQLRHLRVGEVGAQHLPRRAEPADHHRVLPLVGLRPGLRRLQRRRLLPARQPLLQELLRPVAQGVQRGRQRHGHHHHAHQHLVQLHGKHLQALRQLQHHKGKLAAPREQQPRLHALGQRQSELGPQSGQDAGLEYDESEQQRRDSGQVVDDHARVHRGARGEEEQRQQDPAEGCQVRLDLCAEVCLGQQQPRHKGAQCVREAHGLGQLARAHRHQQHQRHKGLVRLGRRHKVEHHPQHRPPRAQDEA